MEKSEDIVDLLARSAGHIADPERKRQLQRALRVKLAELDVVTKMVEDTSAYVSMVRANVERTRAAEARVAELEKQVAAQPSPYSESARAPSGSLEDRIGAIYRAPPPPGTTHAGIYATLMDQIRTLLLVPDGESVTEAAARLVDDRERAMVRAEEMEERLETALTELDSMRRHRDWLLGEERQACQILAAAIGEPKWMTMLPIPDGAKRVATALADQPKKG